MEVGLGKSDLRFGLFELLVQIRRLDLRQQLSGTHVRADVGVPPAQVAVGARVHRRVGERFHRPRQYQFAGQRALRRVNHAHAGDGALLGVFG